MISVLQHAGFDSAVGQGSRSAARRARSPTLFGDTSVAGRIRGKTGTLNNVPYDQDPPAVKALSGYLPVDGGGAIEYTLLLNGGIITDQSEYRPIWAELVNALTSFPAVASPAALGPQVRSTPARKGAPIAVLIGLAAVPAVVLAGLWQYADAELPPPTTTTTTTAPPPATPALATDLLSYRRHPTPLADEAAATATADAQAAQNATLLGLIPAGSCVRIADGDTVVAETGAGNPVIPASNEKLFVAAVALDVLGADYRFRTEVQSPPPLASVVAGNVYLVGGGDPVLRTADVPDPLTYPSFNTTALEPLADQIAALGITTIDGDIVGDGSRYDDEFRVAAWGDDIDSSEAGPYDALLVNDGLVSPGNYGLDPSRSAARIFYDLLQATRRDGHRRSRQCRATGRRQPHDTGIDRVARR